MWYIYWMVLSWVATSPGASEEKGDLSCGGLGPNPRSWAKSSPAHTPPPHLTCDEEHPEQPPEPGLPHPSCARTPTVLWLLAQLQRDTLPQRLQKVAQQDVMPLLGGAESDAAFHHWLSWLQTSRTT